MTWVKLDDSFLNDPRFVRAMRIGQSASVHLYLAMLTWCSRNATRGVVAFDMMPEIRGPRGKKSRELATSALLETKLIKPVSTGYRVHGASRTRSRQGIAPGKRFEILSRDGFSCQYCRASGDGVELHVDHIHPRSLGGSNDASNLITACKECNLGKGARVLPEEVE